MNDSRRKISEMRLGARWLLSLMIFVSSLGLFLTVFLMMHDVQAKPEIEDVVPYHEDIERDTLNLG